MSNAQTMYNTIHIKHIKINRINKKLKNIKNIFIKKITHLFQYIYIIDIKKNKQNVLTTLKIAVFVIYL